jgi:RHH-type rel operon transcriptional repressor/antitoxin RelB
MHTEVFMSAISFRLPDEKEQQLAALAKFNGRTKSRLANQAISDYPAREDWQIAEIEMALKEADAGEFVPEEEMNAKFKQWGAHVAD